MPLSKKISSFIETHVQDDFYQRRIDKLDELELSHLVGRANPYLSKAKSISGASQFVDSLLAAHLSSSDETLFGNLLKPIAVFICNDTFKAWDPRLPSIDVEFRKGSKNYALFIKSGPSWGNSMQINQLITDFNNAPRRRGLPKKVEFINGCCYGKTRPVAGAVYSKLCGEEFWEFISNSPSCYQDLLVPLARNATRHDALYTAKRHAVATKLAADFRLRYCTRAGMINWNMLAQENSGR